MADYKASKDNSTNLRSLISDAASGVKSFFGRNEQQKADDDEKKKVDVWVKEIELAERFFKDYHTDGQDTVEAFLDEDGSKSLPDRGRYKLNLFNSNIATLSSIMYAKLPKVEADRRFADPNDDVARVAGEMITRILQNDMNDPEDGLDSVLRQALQDRLVPGLGVARVCYRITEKDDPTFVKPEGFDPEKDQVPQVKDDEWTDVEYVHWRDVLWSPCRTPAEMRWIAFRSYMTRGEVTARFGADIAPNVPYSSRGPKLDPNEGRADALAQHQDTAQAEVWEIWDKASRCVYWYVKGMDKFLDQKEDPVGYDGFFPSPKPMVANCSTMKFLPKPDYLLARDLYDEINELELRIALLTKACKVAGAYPAAAGEIKDILNQTVENRLVPVVNWAMFADKGGLKGQIDYFPIRDVAETLQILVIQQQGRIQQLYQVTGMSDIIRGQASTTGVTATEQKIKAQFASTRMQSFQDEFAGFAAALLNKKVELIRKFYDDERILKLSNVLNTPDAEHAQAALQLIRDRDGFNCRISVKAESMSQIDYEALKTERGEFLGSVSQFLGAAAPLLEQKPEAASFLMELLKFSLAGQKGASEMEGVFDRGIAQVAQAEAAKAQQPPPEPEAVQVAKVKNEGMVQAAQAKAAADGQNAQQEAVIAQQEHDAEMAKLQLEMQQSREEHDLKLREMEAKIELLYAQLGFKQEEQQLKLEGQQAEQEMDMVRDEREFEHDERMADMQEDHAQESFERESEQSDARFEQESRHADAAARREAREPKGGE